MLAAISAVAIAEPFGLPAFSAPPAGAQRAQILQTSAAPVPADTLVTIPLTSGGAVPSIPPWGAVELIVHLPTPDKLAVGNTIVLYVRKSVDGGATWTFMAGYPVGSPWQSYGPNGLTVTAPDGTTAINPDPTIVVSLNGQGNCLLDMQLQFHGIANAAVTMNGIGNAPQ